MLLLSLMLIPDKPLLSGHLPFPQGWLLNKGLTVLIKYWDFKYFLMDKFIAELCRLKLKYFILMQKRSRNCKDPNFQWERGITVFSLELNERDKLTLDLLQSNKPSIGRDLWYLSNLIPSQLATEWGLQCVATLLWIKTKNVLINLLISSNYN